MLKTYKIVVLSSILFLFTSLSVGAKESEENYFPPEFENYGQYRNAPDYYSTDHQEKLDEKIKSSNNYMSQKNKARSGGANELSVTRYTQEKDWYCGPASAQMVIKYKKGVLYSQTTLAGKNYLETDLDGKTTYVWKVTRTLQKLTGLNYEHSLVSQVNLGNSLVTDIDSNCPLILNPLSTSLPGFQGVKTYGHYVVGTGYEWNSQGSQSYSNVIYLDPWKSNGRKVINVSDMVTAISKNTGYFIW
ncbi:MAG: C39 family peptidase [Erysipelotrichaceae bacterium]